MRPYNSHKFAYKSIQCVFMGYSTNHKGYKCLDINHNGLYISRHVLFNEQCFPFSGSREVTSNPHNYAPCTILIARPPFQSPSVSTTNKNDASDHDISTPNTDTSSSCPSSPSRSHHSATTHDPTISTPLTNNVSSSHLPSVPVNHHPMITRAKTGIHKPKSYIAQSEPITVTEALKNENWKKAMVDEFQALQRNKTWSLVHLPHNRKAIGCKWLFRIKENPDGSIQRYKARLVAQGFSQKRRLRLY